MFIENKKTGAVKKKSFVSWVRFLSSLKFNKNRNVAQLVEQKYLFECCLVLKIKKNVVNKSYFVQIWGGIAKL